MSKQLNKLLHIATIGKAVGLRGNMKLHIHSDFPEQFKKGVSFFIDKDISVTLGEVNLEKSFIKIVGCSSPEDARKFTNKKLYTTIERTRQECSLKDGEYFWFDIEGCAVVEGGKTLGIVEEMQRIAATNYLSVRTDEALVKEGFSKNFLIPFCKPFKVSADIKEKIIAVTGAMDILEAS